MTLTLEMIESRCEIVGDTDPCWQWKGGKTEHQRRFPSLNTSRAAFGPPPPGPRWVALNVRRLAYQLFKNKALPDDRRVGPVKCGNPCCIRPEHQREQSQVQIAARTAARGGFSTPAKAKAISRAMRARGGLKVGSIERAREVRASPLTHEEAAKYFGLTKSTVQKVRRHEFWKEHENNPFAGLMR